MSTEAANPTPQPLQERDPNVTPAQAPASSKIAVIPVTHVRRSIY